MLLVRKNALGGRPLASYPLVMEERSLQLGYKLGYCSGCNEPIVLRTVDARDVAHEFVGGVNDFHKMVAKLQTQQVPKVPMSVRLAKWLVKDNAEYADKLRTVQEDFRTG